MRRARDGSGCAGGRMYVAMRRLPGAERRLTIASRRAVTAAGRYIVTPSSTHAVVSEES